MLLIIFLYFFYIFFSDFLIFLFDIQQNEENESKVPMDETGTHIIIEDVPGFEESFAMSYMGNFKIMIRKADGFINISQFLAKYGNKKRRINDWLTLKSSGEYVKYLQNLKGPTGIPVPPPISPYNPKLDNIIRGTYVTVDIAYAVAMWVDIKYFHQVIQIVKKYEKNIAVSKYLAELKQKDAELQQIDAELQQKDAELECSNIELQNKDMQLLHKNQELDRFDKLLADFRDKNNQCTERMDNLISKHDEQIEIMRRQHEEVMRKFDEASAERTLHKKNIIEALKTRGIERKTPQKKRYFAIIKISPDALLLDDENCPYKKVAGQKITIESTIETLKKKYGNEAISVLIIKKHTTGIDFGAALFDRLQNLITKHSIKTSRFGIKNLLITEKHICLAVECLAKSLLSINGTNYSVQG